MHCQREHRRRASDKLSVLVARELAAKAGSARKRAKRVVTPATGDENADAPANASDDLADSDAEGPAGDAEKASQVPRGRRLLESDDDENDNNMDGGEGADVSGGAAGKRAVKAALSGDAGTSAEGSGSELNDAGVGRGRGSDGSGGSEPEDGDAAKSLARDAAAEAHDGGGDASSESEAEAEVQSPPPAAKTRCSEPRSGAKPSGRKEVASDAEAAAGRLAGEASAPPEPDDSGSDDDVPLLGGGRSADAPAAAAVTDVLGAEAATGSVLPTEVQDEEETDDSRSEAEVASGCKPGDEAAAAVSGSAGQAAPVAARGASTHDAVAAAAASVAAAAQPAADDDAGGGRERSAAAATPDAGAGGRCCSTSVRDTL